MLTRLPSFRRASTIGLLSSTPAPHGGSDALTYVGNVGGVTEAHVGQGDAACALHEDAVGTVYHDVGDAVVLQQRFERAEAEHVVDKFAGELPLLAAVELDAFLRGDLGQETFDLNGEAIGGHAGYGCRIQLGQTELPEFGKRG